MISIRASQHAWVECTKCWLSSSPSKLSCLHCVWKVSSQFFPHVSVHVCLAVCICTCTCQPSLSSRGPAPHKHVESTDTVAEICAHPTHHFIILTFLDACLLPLFTLKETELSVWYMWYESMAMHHQASNPVSVHCCPQLLPLLSSHLIFTFTSMWFRATLPWGC